MTFKPGDYVYVNSNQSEFYGTYVEDQGELVLIKPDFTREPCWHKSYKRRLKESDAHLRGHTRRVYRKFVFHQPSLKTQLEQLWRPLLKSLAGP